MGNLELKALKCLNQNKCPNIVTLLDHFYDRGTLVLVFPVLETFTIRTINELQIMMRDVLTVYNITR